MLHTYPEDNIRTALAVAAIAHDGEYTSLVVVVHLVLRYPAGPAVRIITIIQCKTKVIIIIMKYLLSVNL